MKIIIKRLLYDIFRIDDLKEEYVRTLHSINSAVHLGQLFTARAELIKFSEQVKMRGSPKLLREKVKFLESRWDYKYRIWKVQSRG